MNLYCNLPREQRHVQQLVDRFNADEKLWKRLEPKRRRRRRRHPSLPVECHKQLDLLDFADARPPEDCVGVIA